MTLINFWDPDDERCQRLPRAEPYFGMGSMAVSWHSDSGLVSGTPVAVYSHTVSVQDKQKSKKFSHNGEFSFDEVHVPGCIVQI